MAGFDCATAALDKALSRHPKPLPELVLCNCYCPGGVGARTPSRQQGLVAVSCWHSTQSMPLWLVLARKLLPLLRCFISAWGFGLLDLNADRRWWLVSGEDLSKSAPVLLRDKGKNGPAAVSCLPPGRHPRLCVCVSVTCSNLSWFSFQGNREGLQRWGLKKATD